MRRVVSKVLRRNASAIMTDMRARGRVGESPRRIYQALKRAYIRHEDPIIRYRPLVPGLVGE